MTPATVNRSTTQLLQKIFNRAKRSWGARFDREPAWRHHRLPEPRERVRELSGEEAARIDAAMREILWPLREHHPTFVFAHVAARTRDGRVRGQRYPISYNGVKAAWKRIRKAAEIEDFRIHDFRHDLATRLLRETGNLKVVQRALNHADITTTTTKYAHVHTEQVAAALARVQSREKTRTVSKRAG